MESVSPTQYLSNLIEAHGVTNQIEGDWVVPFGKLPAIRATWHPGEHNGRLNVDVLLEKGNVVHECFAGIGEGEAAMVDALENFSVNSLHVFLSALWGVVDSEQVTSETWTVAGKDYSAYIGNFGTRANFEPFPQMPENLFEVIESSVKNEILTSQFHWFRLFFCNISGEKTFEALLNNEDWAAGLSSLEALPWQTPNGYYSVRCFLFLRSAV